jgi:uncharacterized protein (DUF58 family)
MRIAIIALVIALAALGLAGFATFAALGMKSLNGRRVQRKPVRRQVHGRHFERQPPSDDRS